VLRNACYDWVGACYVWAIFAILDGRLSPLGYGASWGLFDVFYHERNGGQL